MLEGELRRQRLTEGEVRQAIRASGIGAVGAVASVVVESDGTLSVIPGDKMGDGTALADLVRTDAADESGGAPAEHQTSSRLLT